MKNLTLAAILTTTVLIPLSADDAKAGSKDLVIEPKKDVVIETKKQRIERFEQVKKERVMINQVRPTQVSPTLKVKAWTSKSSYKIGEAVTIFVKPTQDAYITVIDHGTSGKVYQVFPNSYARSRLVRANETIQIPSANSKYQYTAGGPDGTEMIKVIASTNAKPVLGNQHLQKGVLFDKVKPSVAGLSKDLKIELKNNHSKQANTYQHVFRITN